MPDLITHVWFSEQVAAALPAEIAEKLRSPLYPHGACGPDVWFSCGFYGGKNKTDVPRGNYMHEHQTGEFLTALAERSRASAQRDALFAYLSGYLCHYSLDRIAHPYIIYRTGQYDGTAATRRYRGRHMRLERGIDAWVIREKYGEKPEKFDLSGRGVPLRRFPRSLREDIDGVYRSVFGWEDAWTALNRAIRDQRFFYTLLRDPMGLVNYATAKLDNGVAQFDYRLMSYHNRDIDGERFDYLNLRHAPWRHYADPSLVSCESFPDLLARAQAEAEKIINVTYNYVYLKRGAPESLRSAIGNASYTSGFSCDDERNRGPFQYDPLF